MKTVKLLGLGMSLYETPPLADGEVWGLQYTWQSHQLTRAFIMDDEEWILAKNNTHGKDIAKEINSFNFPVYVSKPWASLNNWVEYPLNHVISGIPNLKHRTFENESGSYKEVQGKYFLNSFCYMLALAIFEGFERIELFGMDMSTDFVDMASLEKEKLITHMIEWTDQRDCMSFWIGVAIGRGIEVVVSKDSRLTKPIKKENPVLYGYETSKVNQDIRKEVLEKNEKYKNILHSASSEMVNGDRIIDLTKSGIVFNVYHKEDLPNAKAGDIVAEATPYAKLNENT